MDKLLKDLQVYSKKKGFIYTLTLIIEGDGSGMLVINPWTDSINNPFFEFTNTSELIEEICS